MSTLISEGFLDALIGDFSDLEKYWQGMVEDFPQHPVANKSFRSCVGCTLYGASKSFGKFSGLVRDLTI